jgi:signal transduction histidine kinase
MPDKQRIRKSPRIAAATARAGTAAAAANGERRERQISALYELWRAVPHTDTGRLLQMVAERATAAMDAHTCSVLLREKNGDTLRVAASVGLAQDVADSVTMLVGERIAGRVAASGQPILVHKDPSSHPLLSGDGEGRRPADIAARPEVESAMCAPLVAADGAVHGVLCLSRHTPAPPFTDADLRVCSLFAAQAGSVVAQTRTVEDLTIAGQEAAKMEREMERTAGLAALGQLAASVAHELRNPLSSIKGAAQFLLKEFAEEGATGGGLRAVPGGAERATMLEDFLSIVVEEVDGLGRLTTDLLEFARPTPPRRARHDLRDIVSAEVAFLRPELTALGVSDVEEVYAVTNPAYADVDAPQVGRALRNLLLNAAQAMSTRGGVPAGNVVSVLLQRSADPAGYSIVVEDNGPGIPERVLEHLWEPFFTTKARGSGLGLAQVRQVITAHGGAVSAANVRTGGARFVLNLPAASATAATTPEGDTPPHAG